jgi:hypothetical protein
MHKLFLVYFVNLYMFRMYLGPSSGGKPYVYNNWYFYSFWMSVWSVLLVGLEVNEIY